jgi:predicted ester cyclase
MSETTHGRGLRTGFSVRGPRAAFDPNAEEVALRSFEVMAHGTREDFEALIAPDWVNHEAKDEPPEARQPHGPAACEATALWLRAAYADLRWEITEVVAERDLVVVHCTMSGRHTGEFIAYDEHGRVDEVFPPTGKTFSSTQTHWIRVADGKMTEHWANRDDFGMARQLGWAPPSPVYLVRMLIAGFRARRRARRRPHSIATQIASSAPWNP